MASVSKNPFTDMTQTHTRFASTWPPGCQRLLPLLAPAQLEGTTCCKESLCFPLFSRKPESLCRNHCPAWHRAGEVPLTWLEPTRSQMNLASPSGHQEQIP